MSERTAEQVLLSLVHDKRSNGLTVAEATISFVVPTQHDLWIASYYPNGLHLHCKVFRAMGKTALAAAEALELAVRQQPAAPTDDELAATFGLTPEGRILG